MKKIFSTLIVASAVSTALVACNSGGSGGGGGGDKKSPLTVSITPNNLTTGIEAKIPIMINAIANSPGVESFNISLSNIQSDTNINGVESSLICAHVNTQTQSNNCNSNFLLKPTAIADKNYTLNYSYLYNGKEYTGTTSFTYNVKKGQVVDGVAVNTNYVYGTTTLTFINTNSTPRTVNSLTPTSGFSITNDGCSGKVLDPDTGSCNVTITPAMTSLSNTHQVYSTKNEATSANSLKLNYSDGSSASYDINIEAYGYPISNINTQNGFIRIRYQWQNPSSIGEAYNNRDLDIKNGFIGSGVFEQVANEYLGFGFSYSNIGYYGMMAGYDAQDALVSPNTFMSWAGDTIAGSDDVGLASEAILVDFAKLNTFGSTPQIQIPLAAHWYSRSGTNDDNFNIIIDVYPSGTIFEAVSINGDKEFVTETPPSFTYNLPAYTTVVDSTGGTYGFFSNFGTVSCNLTNSTCIYQ